MSSVAGRGSTFNISREPSLQGGALQHDSPHGININFTASEYHDSRCRKEMSCFTRWFNSSPYHSQNCSGNKVFRFRVEGQTWIHSWWTRHTAHAWLLDALAATFTITNYIHTWSWDGIWISEVRSQQLTSSMGKIHISRSNEYIKNITFCHHFQFNLNVDFIGF